MTSVSLSEISYSITKNKDNLHHLIKGPSFDPIWFEKSARNPKKAKSFTGNFAVTYHFQSKSHGGRVNDYGIRLWHSIVKQDDIDRYRRLNSELERLNRNSPDFIRFAPMELFEPEEHGFLVKGIRHPCLKMEWQDAENLDVFVHQIMQDKNLKATERAEILREIKGKMLKLSAVLHKNKCSHGDLSSGNLMISQDPRSNQIKIHVIDFDSFYSESLSNLKPSAIGHEDWQHPKYINNSIDLFGLKADYIPLLCIIVTLEALATNRMLYEQYSPPAQDGSGILIRKKDLINPNTSPIFKSLLDLNQGLLTSYVDDLIYLLERNSRQEITRPKSIDETGQTARPRLTKRVQNHIMPQKKKIVKPSWELRKSIKSESDLIDALENGAEQMLIHKALNGVEFKKKFGPKNMLRFYELAIQHFGGLENCIANLQTQYVWALLHGGKKPKSMRLAGELYQLDPSNLDIGYIIFKDLKNRKKWKDLYEYTKKALNHNPKNINVNIFNSISLLNMNRLDGNRKVSEAFADARVRTNDDWRVLCEIISQCRIKNRFDEELILEVFPLIMEFSKSSNFDLEVEKSRDKFLVSTVLDFLELSQNFTTKTWYQSILMINPSSLSRCRNLPHDWKVRLAKQIKWWSEILNHAVWVVSYSDAYQCISVLSSLAIWGTGDPDRKLAEQLQLLIFNCEWESSDKYPIAASFSVSKNYDKVIVYINGQWYYNNTREQWNAIIGNIWET